MLLFSRVLAMWILSLYIQMRTLDGALPLLRIKQGHRQQIISLMIFIPIRIALKMTLPNDINIMQIILMSSCPCLVLIPASIITLVITFIPNKTRDILIMPKKVFSFLTQRCRGGVQLPCLLPCLLPSLNSPCSCTFFSSYCSTS